MVNFAKSYQAGLDAARIAEKNKIEIDSVFSEMNRQLSEASEKRVRISIKTLDEKLNGVARFNVRLGAEPKTYTGIVAENPAVPGSTKELARWTQGRSGYPCTIILGSHSRSCEDRIALERALAEMLSDPIVGKALSELVNLPVPEGEQYRNIGL